jgi:hypothetical protein
VNVLVHLTSLVKLDYEYCCLLSPIISIGSSVSMSQFYLFHHIPPINWFPK